MRGKPKQKRPPTGQALHNHLTKTSSAPPAPKGNRRGLKHGLNSEVALAPVRAKHIVSLSERYPDLDELRLALLADRLARIEMACAWLDTQGDVVRDEHGHIYKVVAHVEKWVSKAESVLREIESEHKSSKRFDLAGRMAQLDSGD